MRIKFLLLWITAVLSSTSIFAQGIWTGAYGSMNTNLHCANDGQLIVTGYIKFFDTADAIDSLILVERGKGFWVLDSSRDINASYVTNDSVEFWVAISYDIDSLPFYPRVLTLLVRMVTIHDDTVCIRIQGRVFFAPWDTVEVWNNYDYIHCLDRVWANPNYDTTATRVYINKDSIPISNIIALDSFTETWQDDYQLIDVPGLAYKVKMKPIHPDTVEYYSAFYGDDSIWHDTSSPVAFLNIGPLFTGVVTGRLFSRIDDDRGVTRLIPLCGILVKLKEQDSRSAEEFGSTHTNEEGRFTFNYSKHQTWEGGQIELFLKFKSKNEIYNIKVKEDRLLGGSFEDVIAVGNVGQTAGTLPEMFIVADDNLDDGRNQADAFSALHWAVNAARFIDDQQIGGFAMAGFNIVLGGNDGSRMNTVADMFPAAREPLMQLDEGADQHENTIYHEFGHYWMYVLQGNTFKLNYHGFQCNLDHALADADHSELSFIEGFAEFVSRILDAHYWQEDQEYDRDENVNEWRYETPQFIRLNNVNNGLQSEYLFCCALYDLWDGPGLGLPATIPGTPDHGYEDRNGSTPLGWTEFDDVQLSLDDIVSPIYSDLNYLPLVQNTMDYMYRLINHMAFQDCEKKAAIRKAFYFNRVVMNIDDVNTLGENWNTMMSTDAIYEDVSFTEQGRTPVEACIINTNDPSIRREYIEDFPNSVFDLNDGVAVTNYGISDNLRLGYNFPDPGDRSAFNYSSCSTCSSLTMETCGGASIWINNSTFTMGNGSNSTTLVVSSDSRITLDAAAILIINDHSKLTINEGAELLFNEGAQIILNGDNAILEIKGTVRLMDGATFTVSGGGNGFGFIRVIKNYPPTGPVFVNNDNQTCNIELIGNDNTDKLLEIRGSDGLYIGMPGEVILNSCRIEMETGSKLNTEVSTLTMDNVKVGAYNNVPGHRGIMVPGYTKTHVYYTNVEDGKWGFWFYKQGVQKAFDIRYVDIVNCETGIVSNAVDFNYFHGNITGYSNKGIDAFGMAGLSNFEDVHISVGSPSSSVTGIYRTGGGSMFMNKSSLNNNNIGFETWDGNVTLRCTQVTNSNDLGFKGELFSKLKMGGGAGGYNLFEDNENHILSRYDGQWIIKDGRNVLIGPDTIVKFWVSMGTGVPFVDVSTVSLNGSLNYLDGTGASPWTVTSPSLLEAKSLSSMAIVNHEDKSSMLSDFLGEIETVCEPQGPCLPCEMVLPYDEERHGEVNEVISTGLFGTVEITEILPTIVDSANQESPNYDFVLTAFCQILNFNYIDTPPNALQGLLRDIYSDKMAVYQRAMSEYSESSNFNHTTMVDEMLGCNSGLLADAKANKLPWRDMMYELYRDRAFICRFDNRYDSAFEALDSGLVYVAGDDGKTNHLEYLECLFTGEVAILDSLIEPDSILFHYPCSVESYAPPGPQMLSDQNPEKERDPKFKIYPNPTNALVFIEGEGIREISIFNNIGILVGQMAGKSEVSQEIILDMANLPKGLYIVKVRGSDGTLETHKITLY